MYNEGEVKRETKIRKYRGEQSNTDDKFLKIKTGGCIILGRFGTNALCLSFFAATVTDTIYTMITTPASIVLTLRRHLCRHERVSWITRLQTYNARNGRQYVWSVEDEEKIVCETPQLLPEIWRRCCFPRQCLSLLRVVWSSIRLQCHWMSSMKTVCLVLVKM